MTRDAAVAADRDEIRSLRDLSPYQWKSGIAAWLVSTDRFDSVQSLTLIGVLPSLVTLLVPSLRIAPDGTPLMVNVVSELLSPVWLAIATARSLPIATGTFSTPVAVAVHVTVGAAGVTVTVSVAVACVLISPSPSFSVAVAVSWKLPSKEEGRF